MLHGNKQTSNRVIITEGKEWKGRENACGVTTHVLALRLLLTVHNCFFNCLPEVKGAAHEHQYDKGSCL